MTTERIEINPAIMLGKPVEFSSLILQAFPNHAYPILVWCLP
jgi:hypothetical protein